ncbi:hypothetical protein EJB05_20644, partial [Eragrostis curvula]
MTEMTTMGKLVRRMQQTLIKVYKRVSGITETVTKKLKNMQVQRWLSEKAKTEEEVQQKLREIDERVFNAVLGELDGGHCPGEELVDGPVPALKDGDIPGEPDEAPHARALRMDLGSCYIQDHDEDSHFVHAEAGVVGVADGVSAFRKKGVDAGAFARALMDNAFASASRAATRHPGTPICPYTLLRKAYSKAVRSRTPGASTAVIVSLHDTTLKWAYVGDSGFAVLRGGKIAHRSAPQQHQFNCPFQLRASKGGDRVADAAVGEMAVAEGDVVVVGTDGLFDNVFDEELERVVRNGTKLGLSPQDMADNVAATACEMARRRLAHSPFSIESWRQGMEGKKRFYGGKVDDITVVVAYVVPSDCN